MSEQQKLMLTIQAGIPIGSAEEGDELYRELKIFIINFSEKSTMNGQIIKRLEPCCKKTGETNATAQTIESP